jgi:hypothetical protein
MMSAGRRNAPIGCSATTHAIPVCASKKVDEESNVYSVRIGLGCRALGVLDGSTVIWFWIGTHAECDRLLG